MATYPAIAAVSGAILGLLERGADGTEFAGTSFAHYRSNELQTPMSEGVSLYLYRVSVNQSMRNLPPHVSRDGRRFRPPVPVDLHYLLTAWGDALKQQRLLGWCIRTVEDTRILPSGFLNDFGPETDTFEPGEAVELIWEQVTRQELFDIWEVAKANQQPSVTYAARLIKIASELPLDELPPVQTVVVDHGRVLQP
jgi:hypothetical protein